MAKKRRAPHDLKDRLLLAALPHAAFDGWGDGLLAAAAKSLKVSEDEALEAYPDGAFGLAQRFSAWADEQALARLPAPKKFASLRVRDKIASGVRCRLEALEPHRQAVSAVLAYMALPPRNLALPKMVWKTADALWRAAGDTSTDYNYYTKRLLLSGVLTSTTLFWLNDKSEGAQATWKFLDRRIENVLKIGKAVSSLRKKKQERA